ncbi:MAG: hypothetical protein HWD58_07990 [Bacteroidota bacterium]|nr:MAG: hypothetical protein HWD58_07990 [Bacteroidota bacterium]
MKRIFIVALLAFSSIYLKAQEKDYANYPYWIAMIDRPETNYYEALKAYTITGKTELNRWMKKKNYFRK